jgi:hypothetical protein
MKERNILKETLYHIHRKKCKDELWKVGKELEVGMDNNPFFDASLKFDAFILIDNQKYPFLNAYEYFKEQKDIENQINLLNIANNFIHEYQLLIRELGMEEVRKKFYPHLPSRQKCIWLCRKNQIDYWKKFILGEFEIFEVEIFDLPFKTRNSLISLPPDSYTTILNKAQLYWSEKNYIDNEDDEYLYVGKLKIISKFEEP